MKILNFLKKNWKKPIFFIPVILFLVILFFVLIGGKKEVELNTFELKRGDVIQEVNVIGRVKPIESVNLAFEEGGKIENIFVETGDRVEKNEILLSLNNSGLKAELLQSQANYESELALLREMEKGTRPEEIQSAETSVSNAERTLKDAENKLEISLEKAKIDLNSDYQSLLTATQKGAITSKNALITLSDIQIKYYTGNDNLSRNLADAKSDVINSLFSISGGSMGSETISGLSGGSFGVAQSLKEDEYQAIENSSQEILTSLRKTSIALNIVPISEQLTDTEKTNLSTEKVSVETEITSLSSKQQDLSVQKVLNTSNIISAQADVNSAKNTLATAQDNLNLKIAGYTQEQIDSQSAIVKSFKSFVLKKQVQLEKTNMKASFSGIITKIDTEEGEIVSANQPVISLISENEFEIETNIAEVDISKIQVNNMAEIILDSYGNSVVFQGKISEIDPAETIIEGVPTYKTKLIFEEDDMVILSGMTANISILANKKENVLFIPQRAIIRKNGDKFVRILEDKKILERKIETGLRGSQGTIEIISGLDEGEIIVVSGGE
jgi:RND family efflux transporter MFP subunit